MNLHAGASCVGHCGVYVSKIMLKYAILAAALLLGIMFVIPELLCCILKIPKLWISSLLKVESDDDLFEQKYFIIIPNIGARLICATTELLIRIFKIPEFLMSFFLHELFSPNKVFDYNWSNSCNESYFNNKKFGIVDLMCSISAALMKPKKYLEDSIEWIDLNLRIDDTLENIEDSSNSPYVSIAQLPDQTLTRNSVGISGVAIGERERCERSLDVNNPTRGVLR